MPVEKERWWGQCKTTHQFILLTISSCGHGKVENKKGNKDNIILRKELNLKSRETEYGAYWGYYITFPKTSLADFKDVIFFLAFS